MNLSMEFARKTDLAYSALCKPLCQTLKIPQTAFDILLFLANNPEYSTARDIVEIRHIKANLVSVNVDRLVQEGYLERRTVAGDRRKTQLLCTEQARPIVEQGRKLQAEFLDALFAGVSPDLRSAFDQTVRIMGRNLDVILEGEHK